MAELSHTSDNISLNDKLKVLGLDEANYKKQTKEKLINEIYAKFIKLNEKKPNKNIHIKKPKTALKIDKADDKYKLVLEFLNALLVKIGKVEIDDITKFKDIKRDDLLKPECTQVLSQYLDRLVKQFGKTNISYRKKDEIETYILTVLRNITSYSGYKFSSKNIVKNKTISVGNYKHDYSLLYSIN